MRKVDTSNEFVRKAIWDVYKHRCFYTGSPLDYKDMELDHIIPTNFKNKPEELRKIILECNLGNDFEINSLFNLVPTNKYENKRKSDMKLESTSIIHFLGLVKIKVPDIEKKVEQLKKARNYEEHIFMLKTYVNDEENKDDREKKIDTIVNFIINNKDFTDEEQVYYKNGEEIYKKYTKKLV